MMNKPDGIIIAFRIVLKLITKLFFEERTKLITVANQKGKHSLWHNKKTSTSG